MGKKNHTSFTKNDARINREGRPKGAKSFTTHVREALEAVSENDATTEQEELVKKIIEMAKKGDQQMIKLVWNYLDGMPVQTNEHTGKDGEPIGLSVLFNESQKHENNKN